MKKCLLYPGQGAQHPGMGKDLWDYSDKIKQLFKTASESAGIDLPKLLFHGSEEELKPTDKAQTAVTLINIASSMLLKEQGIESDICAGFSLGELSAFWDAGIINTESLFEIVRERGLIMEKVSRSLDSPGGSPGMAAVVGLEYDAVESVLKNGDLNGVFIANYNSPLQIVISGTDRGLSAAEGVFKETGAKRFIRLKVSGPFHCPLMNDAEAEYAEILKKYKFNDPFKKVYSNVTGKLVTSGDDAKSLCSRQLTSTVFWVNEEQELLKEGVQMCIESGPGTVLAGLWKAVGGDIPCLPAGKIDEILKYKQEQGVLYVT
ncbi:MAG: ACP S-malonyltransferase [Spirochaetia bacterium]|jgi:[acyl-carrier-protein] S-malonyltransferase|nr:ACP S-malonyltransferase [Spirochaetia bacterium]